MKHARYAYIIRKTKDNVIWPHRVIVGKAKKWAFPVECGDPDMGAVFCFERTWCETVWCTHIPNTEFFVEL